jgi:hypothetical protein
VRRHGAEQQLPPARVIAQSDVRLAEGLVIVSLPRDAWTTATSRESALGAPGFRGASGSSGLPAREVNQEEGPMFRTPGLTTARSPRVTAEDCPLGTPLARRLVFQREVGYLLDAGKSRRAPFWKGARIMCEHCRTRNCRKTKREMG